MDNDVGRSRIRRSPKGKEKDKEEEDEDKREKKKQKEEKDEEKVEKKDKPKKSFWVRSYKNMSCQTYHFRLLLPLLIGQNEGRSGLQRRKLQRGGHKGHLQV